ncbi:hypothetical protein DdX_14586 [Ditylenchus destructor]|uniref:Uncharacterized protein n=1 Tax=Ditylenchus destructor TaxID=166010 RepID=A0AAD4R1L3_9BILA|nr:hypothetical protein DdX_14586 [Ditylenchus destructor]
MFKNLVTIIAILYNFCFLHIFANEAIPYLVASLDSKAKLQSLAERFAPDSYLHGYAKCSKEGRNCLIERGSKALHDFQDAKAVDYAELYADVKKECSDRDPCIADLFALSEAEFSRMPESVQKFSLDTIKELSSGAMKDFSTIDQAAVHILKQWGKVPKSEQQKIADVFPKTAFLFKGHHLQDLTQKALSVAQGDLLDGIALLEAIDEIWNYAKKTNPQPDHADFKDFETVLTEDFPELKQKILKPIKDTYEKYFGDLEFLISLEKK